MASGSGRRLCPEPTAIIHPSARKRSSRNLRPRASINILAARLLERYTMREDRYVGTMNLIYILVVIILILVALLLLAPLL